MQLTGTESGEYCFYASFVPGVEDLISRLVPERLPDAKIIKLLDGAVIFKTSCSYDKLNFFCFNNIFLVIDTHVHKNENTKPIESHIRKILRSPAFFDNGRAALLCENSRKIKSFRLVSSMENKPAALEENSKREMEKTIAGISGLKLDRAKPDTEFWFLYRREGISLFMKRLTRSQEKSLHPGELSPALAWLLCRLGGLGAGETVLDPFCGYGAIAEAAIKYFPVKKFIALDIDKNCCKISRGKKSLKTERCAIREADFFSFRFSGEDEGCFDAIVTDPPWGHYRELDIPKAEFYAKILNRFLRLLKAGGRAVILAGEELKTAMLNYPLLKTERIYPVLVSGKKASIFVFKYVP